MLGLGGGWGKALLALTVGVVGLLTLVSVGIAWRLRKIADADPVVRTWRQVCARLATIGYPRGPSEGPRAYGERVAALRPDLAGEIDDLTSRYVRLRYGHSTVDQRGLRLEFMARARAFRPRRHARRRHATE
jgi:hypothetical protein